MPVGQVSQPLIADDGVAVIMVCTRDHADASLPDRQELEDQILSQRAELVSQQLMADLRRRATIDRHP